MWTDTHQRIHAALGSLADACALQGESGTERLFAVLQEAIGDGAEIRRTIDESHASGLCYDVNALLAGRIADVLSGRREKRG